VALADGTDLVLLTTDLAGPAGGRVTARQVLVKNEMRNSPVSWSPTGDKVYYTEPSIHNLQTNEGYLNLRELTLAGGAIRDITSFWPKEHENIGFDLSPDGTRLVYEEFGDLFIRNVDDPPTTKPRHITYYGQSLHPTWSGR
jgi:Tol biopolymer transport system component